MLVCSVLRPGVRRLKRSTADISISCFSTCGSAPMPDWTCCLRCSRQPDLGVIVVTAFASIQSAVDAIKRGAVDYVPKPFTPDQIRLAANRVLETHRLERRQQSSRRLDESGEPALFESRSPVFLRFLQAAARAAASDAVLLLRGESGAGKNVVARWIRARCPRANTPFVTVNARPCQAIS